MATLGNNIWGPQRNRNRAYLSSRAICTTTFLPVQYSGAFLHQSRGVCLFGITGPFHMHAFFQSSHGLTATATLGGGGAGGMGLLWVSSNGCTPYRRCSFLGHTCGFGFERSSSLLLDGCCATLGQGTFMVADGDFTVAFGFCGNGDCEHSMRAFLSEGFRHCLFFSCNHRYPLLLQLTFLFWTVVCMAHCKSALLFAKDCVFPVTASSFHSSTHLHRSTQDDSNRHHTSWCPPSQIFSPPPLATYVVRCQAKPIVANLLCHPRRSSVPPARVLLCGRNYCM